MITTIPYMFPLYLILIYASSLTLGLCGLEQDKLLTFRMENDPSLFRINGKDGNLYSFLVSAEQFFFNFTTVYRGYGISPNFTFVTTSADFDDSGWNTPYEAISGALDTFSLRMADFDPFSGLQVPTPDIVEAQLNTSIYDSFGDFSFPAKCVWNYRESLGLAYSMSEYEKYPVIDMGDILATVQALPDNTDWSTCNSILASDYAYWLPKSGCADIPGDSCI